MVTTIREQNNVDLVYMNRKERRKCHLQERLASRSKHTLARSNLFAEPISAEVSSDDNERVEASCKSVGSLDSNSNASMDELEDGELETSSSECSDEAASTEEINVTTGGIA